MNTLRAAIADFLKLFTYLSLISMLVAKELKARYRGTFFGFLWSFLNPFIAMLTYVLVFSVFLKVQMENYSVFLLSALLPWIWFSSAVGEGSGSMLSNGGLIKKIAMPLEIFPFVNVSSNFLNFIFSIPVLVAMLIYFKITIGPALLFFPLVVLMQFLFTFGVTVALSALTVKFRDFSYLIPNLLQIWYFITPIMYPSSMIPKKYGILLKINPFYHFATAYQDMFVYNRVPSTEILSMAAMYSVVALLSGITIFQAMKGSFPEEV